MPLAVQFTQVSRTFGEVKAVDQVSIDIIDGEFFSMLGPSGSGKTTCLRLIAGFEQPTSGSIRIHGVEAAGVPPYQRDVNTVFQDYALFPHMTIADNVGYGLRVRGESKAARIERVETALRQVRLDHVASRLPHQLSGGQCQRVGIARALSTDPKLLLSDEATSALDPETTQSVLDLLARINRELGLTILLITHEMEVVKRIADKVAVIDGGRIVESGSTFDVFSAPTHPTTKVLLSGVPGMQLPDYAASRLHPTPSSGRETALRIIFTGPHATDPILSRLTTELGVAVNILGGAVDEIAGQPFGTLFVSFPGDQSRVEAVRNFLHQQGLSTEVLGHVS